MERLYELDEVEALSNGRLKAGTLRQRLNRKLLSGVKKPKGNKLVWAIPQQALDALLEGEKPINPYEKVIERWKQEQRTGYKRKKTLSENTIDRNGYGVLAFWDYLDGVKPCEQKDVEDRRKKMAREKTLERLTLGNIMQAIANVPRNNPSVRENIYQSTMSLWVSLVHQGLRSELDLMKFKEFRPEKNKRPRRTFIKDESLFKELLTCNAAWYNGRSKYDRILTDILLRIGYYTGLRNAEICNLKRQHVSFREQIIYVEQGKGDKDREVGIDPELMEPLKNYLAKRPASECKNFCVQEDGRPLNRRVISDRIRNLARKYDPEMDLTPHGLRRSFITSLLMEGAPSVLVQKIAGHNKLETTQLYDMTSSKEALDVLRNRRKVAKVPNATVFEY